MSDNTAVTGSTKSLKLNSDNIDLERANNENIPKDAHEEPVKCNDDRNTSARGAWGHQIEFIFTCLGFAVGLGNVWRFPYLCYKNGGGAFLIPFVIMLIIIGLPLFHLEFAIGQFASLGPISIWSISPLFKGVGYAMMAIAWFISIYYDVIIAHAFFYLFASFNSQLPWSECGNYSADSANCTVLGALNNTFSANYTISPAENYYNGFAIQKSAGFHDFGTPIWHLTLCLLLTWVITFLALLKGVQSLGKVSYFLALFPYTMLTALLIRSAMLEGSLNGVMHYLTPDFSRLLDPTVWTDAATQIFFSLSCCNGGLITLSSFNKFRNNCCRDAVIVACLDCLTSVFAGFVVFATLGFMAFKMNTDVSKVVKDGPGLVFIVYPEAINQMPIPVLWSILFFMMLVSLGLGSSLPLVEAILSSFQDEFRRYNLLQTDISKVIFRAAVCSVNFLVAIPMVCPGGMYLVNLVDSVLSGYPLLLISLFELIVICYVYGLNQFIRDIKLMINYRPNWYWRICWLVVTPLTTFSLIIFNLSSRKPISMGNYVYPNGMQVLGNIISTVPVCLILVWFFYKFCREGGWLLLREFLKPEFEWGPAEAEHRSQFLWQVYTKRQKKKRETLNLSPINLELELEGAARDSDGAVANVTPADGANGRTINPTAFCLALGTLTKEETGFFQSKLSIAEKLINVHDKELEKRKCLSNEKLDNPQVSRLTTNELRDSFGKDDEGNSK